MKTSAPSVALFLASLIVANAEEPRTNSPIIVVDQIVSEALSNNPALKSARANWEAMRERVPQARAWMDPRAGLDANAHRFVEVTPDSFEDYKFSVEQTVPIGGRKHLEGKAAVADAAVAFGEYRRKQLDLAARARSTYYHLANAHEQLAINHRNIDLLKQYVEISRARYEVGTKPESDVLAAQTELGKLEEARFDFERQISDAESQLNVLMNRPGTTSIGTPGPLEYHAPDFSTDRLQGMAFDHRPELFMARHKIDAARQRVESARRGWIPDPTFHVDASQYNQSSRAISDISVGVSFDLPFVNRSKYSAAIRENQKLLESAEHDLAAAQNETLGLIREHLKAVETFHHHAELFRDKIIPLARQNITATRLSYETDKTGLLNLIDAQRTLQDAESMYWSHLSDYLAAVAELEAMVGTDLHPTAAGQNSTHQNHHE